MHFELNKHVYKNNWDRGQILKEFRFKLMETLLEKKKKKNDSTQQKKYVPLAGRFWYGIIKSNR